jgi:quinol monooxygenase YgiN
VSRPLVYVDTSEVREGALEELKGAIEELVEFVDANEPQLIAYSVYFSDDGREMTVVQVHADSASLEHHMDVAGPVFRKLSYLLTLSSIHVYGELSDKALRQLHEKARLLGRGNVRVHRLHAGFARFGAP